MSKIPADDVNIPLTFDKIMSWRDSDAWMEYSRRIHRQRARQSTGRIRMMKHIDKLTRRSMRVDRLSITIEQEVSIC